VGYLGNWLPVVWSGVALIAFAPPVVAKTPLEVAAVAKAVTVKIEHSDKIGTGVIVHKQGQVYSLITNRHVVCEKNNLCNQLPSGRQYRLSLPDGQQIQVNTNNIQLLGQGLDLAVIQFSSNRSYPMARVADPGKLRAQDEVFTAGFPEVSRQFEFGQGRAIAVVNRRIQGDAGGYSVVYNSPTLSGMSGGGVFDRNGDLVAIHGRGDQYGSGTDVDSDSRVGEKIGMNRGIPVRWLLQGLGERGIIVGERKPLSAIRAASAQVPEVADEYFIAGFNKWVDPGINTIAGKREAIAAFTKATQLNSRYWDAYFMRALTYRQIGEYQNALADYNRAVTLNPKYAEAYNNRGVLKQAKLNDPQGSLADYDRAIIFNPKYIEAYNNRGILKQAKLNDPQGSLADYNKAIILNPNYAETYNNRGILKQAKLNDPEGALIDYNRAITLNPNYANAYNGRGSLRYEKLEDPLGALADYDKAISLNPKYTDAYSNRGTLKYKKLNDPQGALADYNQAIALNRNLADVYNNRGLLKNEMSDPQGALVDFNQAISLHERSTNALNPDFVHFYISRGILRADKLNDFQGALADFNQAIALNPNFVNAYGARGVLKTTGLNDRPGGIADLRQAARLARSQGQTQLLQSIIGVLNQLGATE
jgi:tetratricopeptide (TPR) repeat protein